VNPENLPSGELSDKLRNWDIEFKQAIQAADVIWGVDVHDEERRSLFYGKETMELIIASNTAAPVKVLRVPVDFDTDDLDTLAAACNVWKGSCCYHGVPEPDKEQP
jgi:hypothetical protein